MKVRDFNIHLDVAITEITCHSLSCRWDILTYIHQRSLHVSLILIQYCQKKIKWLLNSFLMKCKIGIFNRIQHITWIVALVPTDAHRIDAFGTDHFADLCGQTIHVSGYAAPADVVECYLVEFTVATWECNRRAYNQVVCRLQRRFSTPICRLIGRLCSTTREKFHGCISMHFKHTAETRAWQDCTDKYYQ